MREGKGWRGGGERESVCVGLSFFVSQFLHTVREREGVHKGERKRKRERDDVEKREKQHTGYIERKRE